MKQHLAHKTGDVAPCPEVAGEVERDVNTLLQEFKEKKADKIRRTRDLEQEIARSINRIDVDEDDDEDDDLLAFARYRSLQQHLLLNPIQVPKIMAIFKYPKLLLSHNSWRRFEFKLSISDGYNVIILFPTTRDK